MNIRSLAGKSVCILGYGREGQAMALALEKYAEGCKITIADSDAKIQIPKTKFQSQLGKNYLDHLAQYDLIIKSPGIPPHLLTSYSLLLTTPTQIFLDSIASSGSTVIGVTGSKGKSTTASLIHNILKSAGNKSFLVGNIGEAAISHIGDAGLNTFFVQEMSSFQLMDLTSSPHIAVITSFFPEHLDYHHSTRALEADSLMASTASTTPLENYLEAKKHITRFQNKDDVVFFNADSKGAKEIAEESKGKKISFNAKNAPVTLEEIQLKGEHNLGNIAAAFSVAMHLGIDRETAIQAIKSFKGLPHRLESLGVHDGIEWVNDSISTTPQSAIAALDALGDRVETMILGGQDRGYDFEPLVKRLQTSSVKTLILMPDSGATIRKKLEEANATMQLIDVKNIEEAVDVAKRRDAPLGRLHHTHEETPAPGVSTNDAPIVLLSPSAPSYPHFKNFEDRGDQFKAYCSSK